jgi:hypothetical protein
VSPTNPAQSFAWPLDKAIAAAIEGDTGIGGLRDPAGPLLGNPPVWSNVAGPGAALDYIVLGDSTETESPATPFGGHARDNGVTLHAWTRDTSKRSALRILARLVVLLHRRPLDLVDDAGAPLRTVVGDFEIVTVIPDPSGDVSHGVGRLVNIITFQRASS